jgi:signal transduction histidine kinase
MGELARLALDALPHAVFVAQSSAGRGRNLYVNAAYTRLSGHAAADALDPSFDAGAVFSEPGLLEQATAAPIARRAELLTRAGGRCPVFLTLNPTTAADGHPCVVGLLAETGTEDRGASAEPLSPEGDTAASREIRDSLLSALSHELRSPLNACTMWLDVLAAAPPGESPRKAVDALKRNLSRQARAISSISDAAKLSSGDLEPKAERVELVAVLRRNLDAWRLLASAKQQSIDWKSSVATAPVATDPDRLLRVLTDLLDNASDRTAAGGALTLALDEAPGGRYVVTVRDGGAPLSATATAQLFEPLWRSAHARGDSRRRIGLSIAVDLVRSLGGTLETTSDETATTFAIGLPRAAVPVF